VSDSNFLGDGGTGDVRNSNVLNGDGGAFCFPMQIGNEVLRFCFCCIGFPWFSSRCSPFGSHNEALTFLQFSLKTIHSNKSRSIMNFTRYYPLSGCGLNNTLSEMAKLLNLNLIKEQIYS